MKKVLLTIIYFCFTTVFFAQEKKDFVMGADIGWTKEFEAQGRKFFDYNGNEMETTVLMQNLGMDAIRLRVWVDPKDHGNHCSKEEVLEMALRAKNLGMDVMIDFHYSDWWADPGKQNIPESWKGHKFKLMLKDVANHTKEVLSLLKSNGVEPRWVQVGNETSNGMLWPIGHWEENPAQYAGFFKAGYDAVKEILPEAKVLVHLDNGFDDWLYNKNLDILRDAGAKWDMIGMSVYPYWAKDSGKVDSAARVFAMVKRNIRKLVEKYGTDVMIVETGFEVNENNPWKMEMGREQLSNLLRMCKNETEGHCKGVFYWEPTAMPSHYKLGAFTSDGRPTAIMRAFTIEAKLNGNNVAYDRPLVKIVTSKGDILAELYNETPLHRDNYIKIAESGRLNGTTFHRVIKDFMIQGGARDEESVGETLIKAEIMPQFFHKRGALAAAREADEVNPERMSSGSQFYIVWGQWPTRISRNQKQSPLEYYSYENCYGTPWLDGGYTIFGEIIDGLDVVEQIQAVATDSEDHPLSEVQILSLGIY